MNAATKRRKAPRLGRRQSTRRVVVDVRDDGDDGTRVFAAPSTRRRIRVARGRVSPPRRALTRARAPSGRGRERRANVRRRGVGNVGVSRRRGVRRDRARGIAGALPRRALAEPRLERRRRRGRAIVSRPHVRSRGPFAAAGGRVGRGEPASRRGEDRAAADPRGVADSAIGHAFDAHAATQTRATTSAATRAASRVAERNASSLVGQRRGAHPVYVFPRLRLATAVAKTRC